MTPRSHCPSLHGHRQPLAAAYRTALGDRATALLAAGARRPGELFAVSEVRELVGRRSARRSRPAAADPALDAVRDVDTPEEYAALARWARPRPGPLGDPTPAEPGEPDPETAHGADP